MFQRYWLVGALLALCCEGCSIADRTTYEDSEGALPDSFFTDISNGRTSQDWVVAQLGEPVVQQQGPGSQQIYTYRLSRAQKKHAALLVVLRYDGVERQVEYFHVFFNEGVVQKHWRDAYRDVQSDRFFKPPQTQAVSLSDPGSSQPDTIIPDAVEVHETDDNSPASDTQGEFQSPNEHWLQDEFKPAI